MTLQERQRKAEEKETGRIEAFSDGVFAVAITLLILNIHLPTPNTYTTDKEILRFLSDQWLTFLAFLISFLSIGIMWVNHHRLFTHIKRSNTTLLILNLILLLVIVFIPYSTALLAQSPIIPGFYTPNVIYASTFLLMAIFFNILWRYASYKHRLLASDANIQEVRSISKQYLFGPPLYLIELLLVFISIPASLTLGVLLAIFFALPGRTFSHEEDASKASRENEG